MKKRNRRVMVFDYNLYCMDSYGCAVNSTLDGLVMKQLTKKEYSDFFGESSVELYHNWYKPSPFAKRTEWVDWDGYTHKKYIVVKSVSRGNKLLRKFRGRQ